MYPLISLNASISQDSINQETNDSISHMSVDIGGSLAKLVWFSRIGKGGRFNFKKFETEKMDECISFIREIRDSVGGLQIMATGGGAHRFYDRMRNELGLDIKREDEMSCLVSGLNFLIRQIAYEAFTFDERRTQALVYEDIPKELFPYMIVNIGSGVSILKVTSDDTFERISGTSLGGGTLWGLLSLLTNAKSFDDMLELSAKGDNKNIDMLVGDIYGGDYPKIGLKATTIASSFGKVFKMTPEERAQLKQEDICRSLLYLFSNNIGQIAYLNAQAHGICRIYFSGFFIRGHSVTMNTINYAINFWSKGQIKALFLRHEGYIGAIGAFMKQSHPETSLKFVESFIKVERISPYSVSAMGVLNQNNNSYTLFPLLSHPESYTPDTLILNEASQHQWIDKLDFNLEKLTEMAISWDSKRSEDTLERAIKFKEMYRQHLNLLRKEPNAYGPFTARHLLILREQCLKEMGFTDIFKDIKQSENDAALAKLPDMFHKLDLLQGMELLDVLLDHILAGNMFDWGSVEILELLKSKEWDLNAVKEKIGTSMYNDRENFKSRLCHGPRFTKVLIFVDNSGADIILGILPFTRYLLSQGMQVVLAANSIPSVNDVTAHELIILLGKLRQMDFIFKSALESTRLRVVGTGSASPCINLKSVSEELASVCTGVDLVILEGMGRCIHTNFYTRFTVSSLKIGVFKNEIAARELNANMYDSLMIYNE